MFVLEENNKFWLEVNEKPSAIFSHLSPWIPAILSVDLLESMCLTSIFYSSHIPLLPGKLIFRWFLKMVINNSNIFEKLLVFFSPFAWFYFFLSLLLYLALSTIPTTLFSILLYSTGYSINYNIYHKAFPRSYRCNTHQIICCWVIEHQLIMWGTWGT